MTTKKSSFLFTFIVLSFVVLCQTPEGINYQGIARNSTGNFVIGKAVTVRISIIEGSASGLKVYQETQSVTTDNNGLFAIKIGMGTIIDGAFNQIDWSSGNKFVMSEFDFNDGNGFQLSGTLQMLSVPYSLHAKTSAKALNDLDTLATNEIQSLYRLGNKISISNSNSIQLPDSSKWKSLDSDPNLLGMKYFDGKTGTYEFSNGNPTPGGVSVGLTINNSKNAVNSWSFLDLVSNSSSPSANRSYISFKNPFSNYSIETMDSTMIFFKRTGNSGTTIFRYRPDFGYRFEAGTKLYVAGTIESNSEVKVGVSQTVSKAGAKISSYGGGLFTDRFIELDDANANSHINTYENDITNPLIYKRYFFGHYGDLIIQGTSAYQTGNIHFVTGSTVSGADIPTQRMVIMDNGNVGIGNFISSPPTTKLQIKTGDVYLETIGTGVIMKSPNSQCWRVTIDNSGNLVRTAIACP